MKWMVVDEDKAIHDLGQWEGPDSVLRACLAYVKARIHQLAYRQLHDGGDSTRLVDATRRTFDRLRNSIHLITPRRDEDLTHPPTWPSIAKQILDEEKV